MSTYIVAFCYMTAGVLVPFESTSFEASGDGKAKEKANEWANKNYHLVDDKTWLQVTVQGRGIYSKQLGRS
jgi:hypothetical protein